MTTEDEEIITPLAAARLAEFWLEKLCEADDIDPETTFATVCVASDHTELARVSLLDSLREIRASIEKASKT